MRRLLFWKKIFKCISAKAPVLIAHKIFVSPSESWQGVRLEKLSKHQNSIDYSKHQFQSVTMVRPNKPTC